MALLAWPLFAAFAVPAFALPPSEGEWHPLDDKPVQIACIEHDGQPWCRATARIGASIGKVSEALEHMDRSADVFEAVRSIRKLDEATLHVVMDFPGMMSDRDYVARYTPRVEGDVRVYAWEPVEHPDAPPQDGVVRLIQMAGEWRLAPEPDGSTLVRYVWQADLRGSFPAWAVPIARKKTGNEVLKDLARAHGAALSPP